MESTGSTASTIDKIDMSLGDIIKINKRAEGNNSHQETGNAANKGRKGSGKLYSIGRIQKTQRLQQFNIRRQKYITPPALQQSGQIYTHRLRKRSFSFGKKHVTNSSSPRGRFGAALGLSGQNVNISNLASTVSDSDLMQLFGEFGGPLKAKIHYDAQGCHLGSGTVSFARKSDAVRAVIKYKGVSLDDRPMQMQLGALKSSNYTNPRVLQPPVLIRVGQGKNTIAKGYGLQSFKDPTIQGRRHVNQSMIGGSNVGIIRGTKKHPNSEQLDKELDEYMDTTKWVREDRKTLNMSEEPGNEKDIQADLDKELETQIFVKEDIHVPADDKQKKGNKKGTRKKSRKC